jgi:hypothetical protein
MPVEADSRYRFGVSTVRFRAAGMATGQWPAPAIRDGGDGIHCPRPRS